MLDGTADYLSRTPAAAGSKTDFTISFWMKLIKSDFSATSYILSAGDGTGNEEFAIAWLNSETLRIFSVSSGSAYQNFDYRTTQVFRDPAAWQNWVISFDHNNGTAGDRIRLWINGSEIADVDFGTSTDPVDGETAYWTDAVVHNIGRTVQGSNYAPIYLADFVSLDGTSVTDATSFGEYNSDTGIWVPKDLSELTFGTNGFLLQFKGENVGTDTSGKGNTWTANSVGSNNISIDSCTSKDNEEVTLYPTWEPNAIFTTPTLSNNNLTAAVDRTGGTWVRANLGIKGGIYYWEIKVTSLSGTGQIALVKAPTALTALEGANTNYLTWQSDSGVVAYNNATIVTTAAGWAVGNCIGVLLDSTNGRLYFSVNGDWEDGSGGSASSATVLSEITGGTGTSYAIPTFVGSVITDSVWYPAYQNPHSGTDTVTINFGNNAGLLTFNPDDKHSTVALSNGNLTATGSDINFDTIARVNHPMPTTGKFYFELVAGSSSGVYIGLTEGSTSNATSGNAVSWYYQQNGKKYGVGSNSAYGDTWTTNDVIGVAVDMTNGGDIWFSKNNTWQNSATAAEITAGTTTNAAFTNATSDSYDGSGLFVALADSTASGKGTLRLIENSWTGTAPTGFGEITPEFVYDKPSNSSKLTKTITGVGNYCTWNPNHHNQIGVGGTLSEGNLKLVGGGNNAIYATHGFTSGKFYAEITQIDASSLNGTRIAFGIVDILGYELGQGNSLISTHSDSFSGINFPDVNCWSDGANLGASYEFTPNLADGDMICIAVDIDAGKMWIRKNGDAWYTTGSAGNPATGANPTLTFTTSVANTWTWGTFAFGSGADGVDTSLTDFGQNGFIFTPPSGFGATYTPTLSQPTEKDPSLFFKAKAYEGNGTAIGSGGNAVAVGFQPDWVWIKNRDANDDHRLFDSVRLAQNYLESNSTIDQNQATDRSLSYPNGGYAEMLNAFTSTGFNLGDNVSVNTNNESYVAWCWKAGGAPTHTNAVAVSDGASMTSGSVFKGGSAITFTPHNDATVFPNKMSIASHGGFSIIDYTSTADTSSTMKYPHGLDTAPSMIINKCIDTNSLNWIVFHSSLNYDTSLSATITAKEGYISLNQSHGGIDDATQWNDTDPTPFLVTLGTGGAINPNNKRCLSLCFAKIPGVIDTGRYEGNGNEDGPFVYLGFEPAFVMLKKIDASGNWFIKDNARNTFNPVNLELYPHANDGDYSDVNSAIDFTASGFKIRGAAGGYNTLNQTVVYLAMAESSFPLNNRAR